MEHTTQEDHVTAKRRKLFYRILFIVSGIASTLWFLLRVIPKPSRASYPCMRTAAPIMSGFIIYLLSLSGSVIAFRNVKQLLGKKKYAFTLIVLLLGVSFAFISQLANPGIIQANVPLRERLNPNSPIGEAYGIAPGTVVWVHNPDATNSSLSNTEGDYWWMENNTIQTEVQEMLDEGIRKIALQSDIGACWDTLFSYHDTQLERTSIGYSPGDKIFIKVNLTRSGGSYTSDDRQDTSPQLMYALLNQLINEAGVRQTDITMGDPFRNFRDNYFDKLDAEFPNVTWLDNAGKTGREQTTLSTEHEFFTSDGQRSGRIPQVYVDAKYFINISSFKVHSAAGITLAAKNHQGSIFNEYKRNGSIESNSMYPDYHYCYPIQDDDYKNKGEYRHLVDYMGHRYLGGNTVLCIADALWPGRQGTNENKPTKYYMPPFNGDYASSIFLSQDRVAIEAVGYNFLYEEYNSYGQYHPESGSGSIQDPLYLAITDYAEQAADPALHAVDYDPENDGSVITESMGVFELWNNANDKQYSQNLSATAVNGIHLVSIPESLVATEYVPSSLTTASQESSQLLCYPNPASDFITINFDAHEGEIASLSLNDLNGRQLAVKDFEITGAGKQTITWSGITVPPGNYILQVQYRGKSQMPILSKKIIIQ